MSGKTRDWLKFGTLVAMAFALGLAFASSFKLPARGEAAVRSVLQDTSRPLPQAKAAVDLGDAFASVAEHVKPAVVFIKSERREHVSNRRLPPGFDDFFQVPRRPQVEQGSGSGFIVSQDGYILTNNHVVQGADRVTVRLLDNREFTAKTVGTDPSTDVAVIKIQMTGLPTVHLGDADSTKIGNWVLAIGNPLGEAFTFTVTAGIVSAKGRLLAGLNSSRYAIQDFIQTDAAINPGNSGGPLVNVRGEVIGINSALASETGFYAGYGFAIPINLARTVMNQLITDGKVHRAALGVAIDNVSLNDAQYVGLPEIRGVVVKDIPNDDSPARKAGMEPGDIIVAIDGKPVEYVGQLQQQVGFRKPGDVVQVEVARKGGVRKTFAVKLQPLQDAPQVADAGSDGGDTNNPAAGGSGLVARRLGISVQPVTPAIAQELQLPADARGLLVSDVTPGGPAWDVLADEQRGGPDILLSVEGKPVKTKADLDAALKAEKPGSVVTLRVYNPRQQGRRVERIRLGDAP